jgi:hypothetical protein
MRLTGIGRFGQYLEKILDLPQDEQSTPMTGLLLPI